MRRLASNTLTLVGVLPSILLASCGGGGGTAAPETSTAAPSAPAAPAATLIGQADAVRLAQQATFGPTQALVDHLKSISLDSWFEEQFAATGSNYTDLIALAVNHDYCSVNPVAGCFNRYFSWQPVAMRFYADSVSGQDQLRQRVAFALSELLVASDLEVHSTAGLAALNQIFLNQAFGNYHDILRAVTLNAYMGEFLDMGDSSRVSPSENYAREMLQLFSMGPNALNIDGSLKRDANGGTVPNYTPADIKGLARALTGWTYAHLAGGTDFNSRDYTLPMVPNTSRYDSDAKTFLGTTVPAGATPDASIDGAVNAAFNNSSTPPFIAKFLIQKFVTDNPSAAYIQRVATKFVDNGSGVRGDMKAIIRAILSDTEARGAVRTGASDGKVKEPVLLMTSLARAVGMTSDGYAFTARDAAMGQQTFRAPSVFNYYPPNNPLPQSATLVSPASKLMSGGYILQRHNFVWDWTITGESRNEFAAQSTIPGSTGSSLNWAAWQTVGADVDALLDRLNLLLMANTMTAAQRDALRKAMLAITASDPSAQARQRAQLGFYVIATSPQFQVDR